MAKPFMLRRKLMHREPPIPFAAIEVGEPFYFVTSEQKEINRLFIRVDGESRACYIDADDGIEHAVVRPSAYVRRLQDNERHLVRQLEDGTWYFHPCANGRGELYQKHLDPLETYPTRFRAARFARLPGDASFYTHYQGVLRRMDRRSSTTALLSIGGVMTVVLMTMGDVVLVDDDDDNFALRGRTPVNIPRELRPYLEE